MMSVMRVPHHAAILAATAAAALLATGSLASKARVILHEPVPGPTDATEDSAMLGTASERDNPAAIASGDKVLPAPPLLPAGDKSSEPVLGSAGFGADRSTESTPDRNTAADSTLHYASVFNPDILPFKRMSALDQVREDYTLVVDSSAQTEVAVGGATDRSRDRFWGSMMIKLSPGMEVALPSVAPDMRILSYETEPKVRLVFSKDRADNFFVRSDDSGSAGTYRLVFLADADAGYFAPSLPTDRRYTLRQVSALAPAELRPRLPNSVRKAAQQVLKQRLHIEQDDELGEAFNELVAYFRGFEAKAAPPASENIYLDLCNSQAGVCRHRAFAFMVTANALGIPTRFVSNEAHAFVEVWFPVRGWQRIDLGGAALRLEVSGGEGKTLHRPRAEDPFKKPREYSENYTQLEGDISGLSDDQLRDRRRPTSEAPASGDFDDSATAATAETSATAIGADHRGRISPDKRLPVASTDPRKRTPVLSIVEADAVAYRGGKLRISGQASADGPLPGHPIDVFLSLLDSDGADSIRLKRVVTDAAGRFSVDVDIPASVKLAAYKVHISSPETDEFNGALSD
jgi:transglutaminase-like putative cysteine protease